MPVLDPAVLRRSRNCHNLLQIREIRQKIFFAESGEKLLGSGQIPQSDVGDDIVLGHVRRSRVRLPIMRDA